MYANISDWHVETQYLWELGWNANLDVQGVNALQYTLSINPVELPVSVSQREQRGRWRTSPPYHIVVHNGNPSTQEMLIEGLQVWGQTGQHSEFGASLDDTVRPCFKTKRKKKKQRTEIIYPNLLDPPFLIWQCWTSTKRKAGERCLLWQEEGKDSFCHSTMRTFDLRQNVIDILVPLAWMWEWWKSCI